MLGKARERLSRHANAACSLEDGQTLSFAQGNFDVVLLQRLMFFFDSARALAEFHRVLRPGGCVAVSVDTQTQYDTQIIRALARYSPRLTEAADRMFSLVQTTTDVQRITQQSR